MIRFVAFVLAAAAMLSAMAPPAYGAEIPRLNWLMWWEFARDRCFAELIAKRGADQPAGSNPTSSPSRSTQRDAAIEALRQAAAAGNPPPLRCEAVLALGRIGDEKLLPELIEWADDEAVGLYASVAIGLIGGENAETFLLSANRKGRMTTMAALALLDELSDAGWDALFDAEVSAEDQEVRRLALYAMRPHAKALKKRAQPPPAAGGRAAPAPPAAGGANPEAATRLARARQIMLKILRTDDNPHVAAEAALTLGMVGTEEDVELLGVIACDDNRTAQVPAAAATAEYHTGLQGINHFMEHRGHSVLRVAAAMALVDLKQGTHLRNGASALTPLLVPYASNFQLWFRNGPGMIAMAQAGDDMHIVVNLLHGLAPPRVLHHPEPKGAAFTRDRAFAAIAIGLANGGGRGAAPLFQQVEDTADAGSILQTYVKSDEQPDELRAACALALGLSNGNKKVLVEAANSPNCRSELVRSHIVLALAMLNDARALEGAAQLLNKPAQRIDVDALLRRGAVTEPDLMSLFARRAALQAIALLRDQRAVPLLLGQWGASPWTDREVARGLACCGLYDAADAFIQILSQPNRPGLRASAAASLGEMFDLRYPSRLSRLIEYANCTVDYHPGLSGGRTNRTPLSDRPIWPDPGDFFHSLANPFFFGRVAPSGRSWP